mgnify:CR=1 FL=1
MQSFIRCAVDDPGIELTIKIKGHPTARKDLTELCRGMGFKELPLNIVVTDSVPAFDLIQTSELVAGFTSTTLIEAMILGKPIIAPYFHDFVPLEQTDYFSANPSVVNYIKGEEELQAILSGSVPLAFPMEAEKIELLSPLLHSYDGRSAERVDKGLIEVIEQHCS